MTNQLSKEEIDHLFKFVKSKNVKYKDVQFEIVDHLASAIEEKQTNDDKLTFDKALQDVYAAFPITGFAMMTSSKQEEMDLYWRKQYISYLFSYFKFPKIIIVSILVYIFHVFFQQASPLHMGLLLIAAFIYSLGCSFYSYKSGYNFKEELQIKYLAIDSFLRTHETISFFVLIPTVAMTTILTSGDLGYYSSFSSWLLGGCVTFILIWNYAYTFHFPKTLMKELSKKYSHLNFKLT